MYSRSKVESRALTLGLISIIASGCAAGISSHPHGLGAGEWSVTLPATASYTQGLAYGRGGSSARAQGEADAALFAEVTQDNEQKPAPRKRRTQQTPPAPSTPVPVRQQTPVTPPAAKHERTEIAANTAPVKSELVLADVGSYQAREAQSQAQQQFAGGDAIVIGAGTLVVIILIVLLVLLLV